MENFDYKAIRSTSGETKGQYASQIERVAENLQDELDDATSSTIGRIESVVNEAMSNINSSINSFVIYGDPQSGKTEMMICLTAKLIDEKFDYIVVLVNDSIQLLQQNLSRFRASDLNPAPNSFEEIIPPEKEIRNNQWVIFCKKNAKNLEKLLSKLDSKNRAGKRIAVIDDEADYATPNSKVNKKEEESKIYSLTKKLIGENSVYIAVTATPARLDLNRTHDNDSEKWIFFPPHEKYVGAEIFFPNSGKKLEYKLKLLSDETGNDDQNLRDAIFRFLINVATLNLSRDKKTNYSMLIHTSGKVQDHKGDHEVLEKVIGALKDDKNKKHERYVKCIFELIKNKEKNEEIINYIIDNIGRSSVIIMNSDNEANIGENQDATNPKTLFTFAIGGNIVSRGVTFNNLLSFFFTRDAKTKLNQDTYIQRARMFGVRGGYIEFFELTIPLALYEDWHRMFVFHRLSLDSRKNTNESTPVWLASNRIQTTSPSSIEKSLLLVDKKEINSEIFDYRSNAEEIETILTRPKIRALDKLRELKDLLGEQFVPLHIINFIKETQSESNEENLMFLGSKAVEEMKDADAKNIVRQKGFIGQYKKYEEEGYSHIMEVRHNSRGMARLIYRYSGSLTVQRIAKLSKNNKT